MPDESGIFIHENGRIGMAFGGIVAHVEMTPEEMRALASALVATAERLEAQASDLVEAAIARASGRLQ